MTDPNDGIERWDDGTIKSPGNAFTTGYVRGVDARALNESSKARARSAKRVSDLVARGENPGKILGLSRKSDEHLRKQAVGKAASK